MMSERLGLGSATGVSFLPQSTEFPPHKLTESLCVNNSFSSLASLAGNDSVAGENKGCWFYENSVRTKVVGFVRTVREKITGFVRTLREKGSWFLLYCLLHHLNFVQN